MSRIWMVVLAWVSLTAIPGYSQENKVTEPPRPDVTTVAKPESGGAKSAAANPEQLEQWIKNLVDPKFAVRQTASQKLLEAGSAGMEAVAKAADSKDLELATRCLAVLTEGLGGSDEAVKKSARDALERLTKSENKSVAQRAQQALETPLGPLPGAIVPGPRRGRVPFGAGNNIAIQVRVNNGGPRETKITENGKEIVIQDNNGKDISVSITETINGMKKVTAATGKDADELKKNSPEAHAYYERFGKGNGIQFQFGGNAGILMAQPVRRAPRLINPLKAADLFDQVEKLRQKIDEANDRLGKAAAAEQTNTDELKKICEEIKTATKRLAEIKNESELP